MLGSRFWDFVGVLLAGSRRVGLGEHVKHLGRNREATDDVDPTQEHGQQGTGDLGGQQRSSGVELEHTTDDDDTTDGVGDTNQRRVQLVGDVGYREVTDQEGQNKVPQVSDLFLWDIRGHCQ